MLNCRFELNGQPMSTFECGAFSAPAFSGRDMHRNRRELACRAGTGPIPPGNYFVIDRQTGGKLGWLRDRLNGHGQWFALYADDGRIDDEIFCDSVSRGKFRLHPKGPLGLSEGCITVDRESDFMFIRSILKRHTPFQVPGSALEAYAMLRVR